MTLDAVSLEGPHVDVTVSVNYPDIPGNLVGQLSRPSEKTGPEREKRLLEARGAALADGGDLFFEMPRHGASFRLRLPLR